MQPLAETTVVVTRPRRQAAELQKELEAFGARVILFSTIEIVEPEDYADLDAAVNNLSNYDWLILTSANAAEYFLERLKDNGIDTAELDNLRLCVIGEATAEKMRLAQAHIDLMPQAANAAAIYAALVEYLGGEASIKNLRFLLPQSAIARETLPKILSAAGGLVDDVIAYRTILPINPETAKIKALLQGGAIDCLTFTSPSTFHNFLQILAFDDLHQSLKDMIFACIGETTAQAIKEAGFEPQIISETADAVSFARSIAKYFA